MIGPHVQHVFLSFLGNLVSGRCPIEDDIFPFFSRSLFFENLSFLESSMSKLSVGQEGAAQQRRSLRSCAAGGVRGEGGALAPRFRPERRGLPAST
jgi:hypothetical protein